MCGHDGGHVLTTAYLSLSLCVCVCVCVCVYQETKPTYQWTIWNTCFKESRKKMHLPMRTVWQTFLYGYAAVCRYGRPRQGHRVAGLFCCWHRALAAGEDTHDVRT